MVHRSYRTALPPPGLGPPEGPNTYAGRLSPGLVHISRFLNRGSASVSKIPEAVSGKELGRLLGITDRWVRDLEKQGVIKRIAYRQYDPVKCSHDYWAWKIKTEVDKISLAARDTLRDRREQEIAQRIAIRDRTLINFEEAMAALEAICGLFLGAVSGLPAQITREHGERTRIEGICDAVRRRLSERFAKVMEAIRAGAPVGVAEPEDDA